MASSSTHHSFTVEDSFTASWRESVHSAPQSSTSQSVPLVPLAVPCHRLRMRKPPPGLLRRIVALKADRSNFRGWKTQLDALVCNIAGRTDYFQDQSKVFPDVRLDDKIFSLIYFSIDKALLPKIITAPSLHEALQAISPSSTRPRQSQERTRVRLTDIPEDILDRIAQFVRGASYFEAKGIGELRWRRLQKIPSHHQPNHWIYPHDKVPILNSIQSFASTNRKICRICHRWLWGVSDTEKVRGD